MLPGQYFILMLFLPVIIVRCNIDHQQPSSAAADADIKGPPHLVTSRYVRRHLVKPGDRLRLLCPVRANPPALVTWYKDGGTIHLGWDRYRVRADDWTLSVRDVQLADTGIFTCRATNGFGSIDIAYLVYVSLDDNYELPEDFDEEFFREIHQKGVAPVFTNLQAMQDSGEVSLSIGDSVRLRCDAVGRPRVEVQWFKDDKMLTASGPASASSSSSLSSSPDYYYYDYPHAPGGTLSRSRRVRHEYSHRRDRVRRRRRRRRSEDLVDEVTGSRSRSRSAGDLELDRTDDFYVGDGNERLSLMLDIVTSDDAGLYTCRAFNKAGTVNFTYAVHVTDTGESSATLITPYPNNVSVSAGQKATFRCTISASSSNDNDHLPRVQWLRRIEPGSSVTSRRGVQGGRYVALVKGVGRVDVIMTSSGPVFKSTLVIDDVRPGDAGLYVCSLSTSAGHISSTQAYLTVFTGDVYQTAESSKTMSSRHHRLSLLVVAVITTSCCGVTAVVTLGVVVVVIRHRRRHHAASVDRHEKSATATPLITAFRPPYLPPTTPNHHLHVSVPRLLPDVAKCDSDAEEQHQYDVLESTSAYFWPVTVGGSMPMVGGGRGTLTDRCPCSSCLLASTSHTSRRCSDVLRQTVT